MSEAGMDNAPLFGTAILSVRLDGMETSQYSLPGWLKVGVDVVERDSACEHQDLGVVEQLADLLGGALRPLMLGGHPGLRSLLDQLLPDRVHAGVERLRGARPVW